MATATDSPSPRAGRLTPSAGRGAEAGLPPVIPLAYRMREMVAGYLPLLMMGLLALATWWLVENAPEVARSQVAKAPRHVADYSMNNFSVQRFAADGQMRVRIEGVEMRHFPDTDTIEIDNPRIHATAPDGKLTTAIARQAISNGDGSEVQLLGGAEVIREASGAEAAIEFRGEFLHAFFNSGELRSHLPVAIRRGATLLRADSLDYKHGAQQLLLTGRVRATFAPVGKAADK